VLLFIELIIEILGDTGRCALLSSMRT